jgi:hypothetical protein
MTYEYKTLTISPPYTEDMLNQYGGDGWRLAFLCMQASGLVYAVFEKVIDGTRKTTKRA